MSPYQKKQRQKERKRVFRKWHRRIGFVTSIFFLNLAVTGILLNHYQWFSLHQSYLNSSWLLDWYGVEAPQQIKCGDANQYRVCQLDSQLLLVDTQSSIQSTQAVRQLGADSGEILALHFQQEELHLVTSKILYVYSQDFQLVDSLNVSEEYAASVEDTNLNEGRLYLLIDGFWRYFDPLNMTLQPAGLTEEFSGDDLPSIYSLTKQNAHASMLAFYRNHQITHLKLVQDLHSGQFFGLQGKLFTDLTGVILLLLAMSGFITWQRRKNRSQD